MSTHIQKKVLLATPLYPPDIGGPATYATLMVAHLPSRGFDVTVLSFSSVRGLLKGVRHVLFFFKILWQGWGQEIIFAQDTVSVGFPALCASWILRLPFVVRVPGDYAWEQSVQRYGVKDSIDTFQIKQYGIRVELLRSIQRVVVAFATTVIAPSKYFSHLVSRWPKHPNVPLTVVPIYNGIDFSLLPQSSLQEKQNKTIFSSGRLVPWKGFEAVIHMMLKLPEWHLRIAGEGPDLNKLRQLVTTLNLESRVTFLGRLTRDEVCQELSIANVFVLNTSFESFSFQVVEAMWVGVPVIATSIGNLSEIIDNESEGFLVKPDDEEHIVSVIQELEKNNDLRRRVITRARKKAETFSIDNSMDHIARVLTALS